MALVSDLRYAVRALLKRPGFFLLALLTLTVGIAGASSLFSFVVAWIIDPLPFPHSDRLMFVRSLQTREGHRMGNSAGDFRDFRDRSRTFESISLFTQTSYTLTSFDEPVRMVAAQVSTSFLRTLGVRPAQGRDFLQEEETPGRHRVVLVSDGFWRDRLHADSAAIGTTLKLDGEDYTVIGVMPENFQFTLVGRANLWTPFAPNPEELGRRGDRFWGMIGRLKPEATAARAHQELDTIAKDLATRFPATNAEIGGYVEPLSVEIGRHTGDQIITAIFFITVGLLFIACANVANLLLIRALGRQRQSAIQLSLGASRSRLIGQALVETLMIFLLAAGLGALGAIWLTDFITNLIPFENRGYLPNYGRIVLDWRVFSASLAVSFATGLLFGLAPAIEGVRVDISQMLKDCGTAVSAGRGRSRLRGGFVVAQILLATVVVCSTGILVRSGRFLLTQDLGFDAGNLLTFELLVDQKKYPQPEQRHRFYESVERSLRTIPDVRNVSVSSVVPFGPNSGRTRFWVDGEDSNVDPHRALAASLNFVSPSYFRTLRIPLLAGRQFTEHDHEGPLVIAINDVLAREKFYGRDPIGRRLALTRLNNRTAEIVAVVKEVAEGFGTQRHEPQIYAPFGKSATSEAIVVIRTTGDPLTPVPAVRQAIREVDRFQPIYRVKTEIERIDEDHTPYRIATGMLIVFGLLALCLASVGIYGVVAFSVSQRVKEIGIRSALGASRSDVLHMILRHGTGLLLLGLLPGLLLSLAASRSLHSLIERPPGTDLPIYAGTALILAFAAWLATFLPALRAARIDPMRALRYE